MKSYLLNPPVEPVKGLQTIWEVQKAHRFAPIGTSLRHSGHF